MSEAQPERSPLDRVQIILTKEDGTVDWFSLT